MFFSVNKFQCWTSYNLTSDANVAKNPNSDYISTYWVSLDFLCELVVFTDQPVSCGCFRESSVKLDVSRPDGDHQGLHKTLKEKF